MSEALGWIGNVFLVAAVWLVGRRWRHAFLLTVIGEAIWCGVSVGLGRPDMVTLCIVFAAIALRNWYLWRE